MDTGGKKFRTVGLFPNFGQIFGMMGQMFSTLDTLNRRSKKGERRGGKGRGGEKEGRKRERMKERKGGRRGV